MLHLFLIVVAAILVANWLSKPRSGPSDSERFGWAWGAGLAILLAVVLLGGIGSHISSPDHNGSAEQTTSTNVEPAAPYVYHATPHAPGEDADAEKENAAPTFTINRADKSDKLVRSGGLSGSGSPSRYY